MLQRLALKILILLIILSGENVHAGERLTVFVSILPQKYFVQQIGGNHVDIKVMVLPGASPATYEPKPSQMTALAKASLYFSIGVPFEKTWLNKIMATNPNMQIIKTDQNIKKIPMDSSHLHSETDHTSILHPGESHVGKNLDPHIWLSPKLVKLQLNTIFKALVEKAPSQKDTFKKNYQSFLKRVDALDRQLLKMFESNKNMGFMVFHPSWGYFASAYGLKQVAIEIEGKAPKPSQLRDLIQHARELDINVVFVQPQFSTKSAKLIAKEINGQVVFADSLAENWEKNIAQIAQKFKEALR